MHELFHLVLNRKDLSKVGDLFHLGHQTVLFSSRSVIEKCQEISSSPDYIHNDDDQSIVEICIARVTAAVNRNNTMLNQENDQTYYDWSIEPLVNLLESCLNHDLKPTNRNVQPPHAKIASDILACLFLNYTNRRVMALTLPVAVNFLHKNNTDLMRNVSSYVSLAAIENSDLLAKHVPTIIVSVIAGNYTLIRVLPLIYHLAHLKLRHIMPLALILQYCDVSEKNCLLGLFRMIAIDSPCILDNSLQYFLDQLKSPETATNTLKLLLILAQKSKVLPHHMSRLKEALHCSTTIQLTSEVILTLVHSNNGKFSALGLDMLIQLLKMNNSPQSYKDRLKDLVQLVSAYPYLVTHELIKELSFVNSRVFIDKLIELNRNNTMLNKKNDKTYYGWSMNDKNPNSNSELARSKNLNIQGYPSLQTFSMNRLNIPVSGFPISSKSLTKLNYDRTLSSSNKEFESLSHLAKSSNSSSAINKGLPPPSVSVPTPTSMNTNGINNGNNDEAIMRPSHLHSVNSSLNINDNRMSVFEPFPLRDTIQHFCEKHLDKIKAYMEKLSLKIPLPVKCTIEERKSKKNVKLHFSCQRRSTYCIYNGNFYNLKTKYGRIWIHIMFLALQSRSETALSVREQSVSSLKNCWDILKCESKSFLTLVTSAFPSSKDHENLLMELRNNSYLNVFELGVENQWNCLLCNGKFIHCTREVDEHYTRPLCSHADKSLDFHQEPLLQGPLKEKKGKFKIFKRWRTRYFTLSGGMLISENSGSSSTLQLDKIRSVRVTKSSSSSRNIPKAFEIFTDDNSYVLKPTSAKDAEKWVQCLQVMMRLRACQTTTSP